jgi:hypothetical protein
LSTIADINYVATTVVKIRFVITISAIKNIDDQVIKKLAAIGCKDDVLEKIRVWEMRSNF